MTDAEPAADGLPAAIIHASPVPEGDRVRLRRRTVKVLVAGVALGSTGHIAAVTVAPIVATQLAGTSALSGVPGAAVVFGAAIGASALSALMARRGRRPGISLGYGIGVLGALVAIAATVAGLVPVLMLGMFMIGFGNSSNQLSRYVAADMYPFHRRAATIGTVVWAATVGAVLGPNLVGPSGNVAYRARAAAADRRLPRPDRVRRRGRDPELRRAASRPVRARRRRPRPDRPRHDAGPRAGPPADRRRRADRPRREPGRHGADHDDDARST
jgi:hypothetical protein